MEKDINQLIKAHSRAAFMTGFWSGFLVGGIIVAIAIYYR